MSVSRADPEAIAVAKQLGFKVVVTPRSREITGHFMSEMV